MWTIVTGIFDTNRGSWKSYYRRPFDDYLSFAEKVILRLNLPMVIFCEESSKDFILEKRGTLPTKVIVFSKEDLYLWSMKDRIQECQQLRLPSVKESDKDCPEYCEPLYNIAVNNKAHWLQKAAEENPFSTTSFAWVDFGFGHGKFKLRPRSWWNLSKVFSGCDKSQVFCMSLRDPSDAIASKTKDSLEIFRANEDFTVGQVLLGTRDTILHFCGLVKGIVNECLQLGITDDDQYHLSIVHSRYPELISFLNIHSWENFPKVLLEFIEPKTAILICGNERTFKECKNKEWMDDYDKFAIVHPQKWEYHPFIQEKFQMPLEDSSLDESEFKGLLIVPSSFEGKFDERMASIPHGFHQWTTIQKGYEQFIEGSDYERVIRTRFDIEYVEWFECPSPSPSVIIAKDGVYPPDIFFISSPSQMKQIIEGCIQQYETPMNELSWSKPPHGLFENALRPFSVTVEDVGHVRRPDGTLEI